MLQFHKIGPAAHRAIYITTKTHSVTKNKEHHLRSIFIYTDIFYTQYLLFLWFNPCNCLNLNINMLTG